MARAEKQHQGTVMRDQETGYDVSKGGEWRSPSPSPGVMQDQKAIRKENRKDSAPFTVHQRGEREQGCRYVKAE